MATFPISARNIAAGESTFGPISPAAGLIGFSLVLDVAQLVAPMSYAFWYAADGVNYRLVQQNVASGPPVNRDGSPRNPPNLTWDPSLPEFEGVQEKTVAGSAVKLVVNNTAVFHTAGGSIGTF